MGLLPQQCSFSSCFAFSSRPLRTNGNVEYITGSRSGYHPCGGEGVVPGAVRGNVDYRYNQRAATVGRNRQFCCYTHSGNIMHFEAACSKRVDSANVFRMGSRKLSSDRKSCSHESMEFLVGIVSLELTAVFNIMG
jgi:hypothetical protein